MPGFGSSLSAEEIVAVVCHERVTFGHEAAPPRCQAEAETTEGGEGGGAGGTTEAGGQTGGGSAGESGGGGNVTDSDTDTQTTGETEGGTENPNAPSDTDH